MQKLFPVGSGTAVVA